MSRFQWGIVAVMIALNALDGFDVLSISFASPGIAADWGIDRAALGFVLAMELFGMAVGSIVLGGVADRIGRRATILGCLAVMAFGMFGAATAGDVVILSIWRIITGLGIGGTLAATNAAVAEAANARRRALCVVLMATGYPLGSIIGGTISAMLLRSYDWPAVFLFGGIVTLVAIPLVLWRVPESIAFLMHRRPPGALEQINRTLARMGHPPVATLPEAEPEAPGAPFMRIFSPGMARLSILLAFAYFTHMLTFYFIIKWIPKIVTDMGFPPAEGAGVLVWSSVGGAIGCLIFGLLTQRVRLLPLTLVTMLLSASFVAMFGQASGDLRSLSLAAAAAGMFSNAGVVALFAIVAQSFPASLRATATGFVIGTGRGGSALAPVAAGFLFAGGYPLSSVAPLMALGSILALIALLFTRRAATAS